MKSIPIAIVVILIAAGGAWFFVNRANIAEAPIPNSVLLSSGVHLDIMERDVSFDDGRNELFVEPLQGGVSSSTYPGVVMIHEWWGLNGEIKDMARELAGKGYKVLAVDLYKGKVATTTADAQKYVASATPEDTTKVLKEAVAFLKQQGAGKIASLGWCYGGGKALELALSGEKLDATVIYYGQLVTEPEKLKAISWPVLGIFGDKDQVISMDSIKKFEIALGQLGIRNEIDIYPGVGHAFANPSGMNFAPKETKDAWAKTLAFLAKNLKQ